MFPSEGESRPLGKVKEWDEYFVMATFQDVHSLLDYHLWRSKRKAPTSVYVGTEKVWGDDGVYHDTKKTMVCW